LAIQWIETVESRLGVTPIVYLSPAFATEILRNAPALERFPLWLAHYTGAAAPDVAKPWNSWTFWQYTREGKTPGVTLPVDLDRFNGSLDDLKALAVKAKPSSGGNN
jgi:lysozyme